MLSKLIDGIFREASVIFYFGRSAYLAFKFQQWCILFEFLIITSMDINELLFLGTNKYGQAGIGEKHHNKTFTSPKPFAFPIFIKQISCGAHHSALLTIDGNVYTMGSNIHGALGSNPALNYSFLPTIVESLTDVTKIECGPFHMCAISEGSLYSWGKGIDGQLGHGNTKNIPKPCKVETLGNSVQSVSCGTNHTLVLTRKQNKLECYAFGNGIYGQLGTGQSRNSYIPIKVKLDEVDGIAAGDNHSLFIIKGNVYACGDNSNGQLGSLFAKKFNPEPTKVDFEGQENVVMVQAKKYSLALTDSGEMYVWGLRGGFGAPRQVKGLPTSDLEVIDARVGNDKCYGLTTEGSLYSWNVLKGEEKGKFWTCENEIIINNNRAVLDFSVGEGYLLVLGDIVKQIDYNSVPMNSLNCIEDYDRSQHMTPEDSHFRQSQIGSMDSFSSHDQNSKDSHDEKIKPQSLSPAKNTKKIDKQDLDQKFTKQKQPCERVKLVQSKCLQQKRDFNNLPVPKQTLEHKQKGSKAYVLSQIHQAEEADVQGFDGDTFEAINSQTSSIKRQPINFLKESNHKQDERSKVVACSIMELQQQVPSLQQISKPIRNLTFSDNNKENIPLKKNEKKQKIKKIDRLMQMLEKSKIISQPTTHDSNLHSELSEGNLKQTDIIKTNRMLRIDVREKQLKISQLQELLSRKQMEIEAQRQVIKMLRQKNASNFASLERV